MKTTWRILAVAALAVTCGVGFARAERVWDGKAWVEASPAAPGSPEADLEAIRDRIGNGKNKKAVKAVDAFLVNHGDSPACEEAMSLAGEAQMNRGRYWDAYKWYERQISTYPNGAFFERALDREYKIADAFLKGRKRRTLKIFKVSAQDDGIEILMRISAHAPGTQLAQRSLLRVADYHFDKQQYAEAVKVYDEFVKQNPQSPRRSYAMLKSAKANLLSFRGVNWDITPLLEAAERFRVFAQAYPQAAKGENIPHILAEIRLTLAHKLFHSGKFYERVKRPRAAVFYYWKLLREYPETHWAESARGRMEMMGRIQPLEPQPQVAERPSVENAQTPPAQSTTGTETQPELKIPQTEVVPAEPEQPDDKQDEKNKPIRLEDLEKITGKGGN